MVLSRAERAERTRELILETAASVFAEKGYERTALSDIVRTSGLTKGALYHHFASKEELALAAFRHKQEALVAQILAAADAERDSVAALRTAFRVRAAVLQEDPSARVVLRLGAEFRVDAVPGSAFADYQELAFEAFTEIIRQGQEEGSMRADLDPRAIAELIFAAMVGMDDVSSFLSNLDDLPQRSERLVDLLIDGLAGASHTRRSQR